MRPSIQRLERLVWLLESAFRVPGTRLRLGLDAVLGLIPGAGDAVAMLMGGILLYAAVRQRVPPVIVGRMTLNVLFDFLVGLVPVLGDVGDVFFRSNRRNLDLLRKHAGGLQRPRPGDYLVVWGVILGLFMTISLALYGVIRLGRLLWSGPAG